MKFIANQPERKAGMLLSRQVFRIMKLTALFISLSILQVWASGSYAQSARLSLDLENVSVKTVLVEIENQSEFFFLYSPKIVDVERKVEMKVDREKIFAVLDRLFAGTGTKYVVKGRQIVLSSDQMINSFAEPSPGRGSRVEPGTSMAAGLLQVSGTVTDEEGEALIGVNILVKGTLVGTVTDLDGRFSLDVEDENATLVFSYTGYQPQEVALNGRTQLDVVMTTSISELEEIVVVGYGTQRKKDLTGAVASVGGDAITERQTMQISQALQGAIAGVMVTRNNNAPGSSANILVRGVTTIGDSNPLIIVDGVPIDNINDINPSDVQDISVLKDAASAAIYGARAAAGVILVTTKRAQKGQLNLSYNAEYGFETPTRTPEAVDVVRYMQIDNEMRWNDNGNTGTEFGTFPEDVVNNYYSLNAENPNLYPNVNMWDLVIDDFAPRSSHNLSISAGTDVIRSKLSLAYDYVDGLYAKRSFDRLTARFNNDITINDYITASADIFWKRSIYNDADANPMTHALIHAPIYPAFWDDGRIAPGKAGANIYGQLKEGGFNQNWYNGIGGRAALNVTPVKGLRLTALVAPMFDFDQGKFFRKQVGATSYEDPSLVESVLQWANTTRLVESRSENYRVTSQFLANYEASLGDHNLSAMAGYENFFAHYEQMSASRDQYDLTSFPYLNLGPLDLRDNGGAAWENAYRSWFGRITYNYKYKYYLQANVRFDGSSRFQEDYRWGSFPSFSAGWVISEEPFLQGGNTLSFLKLRGSWGTLGNERIGNYPYQATIAFSNALLYQGSDVVSVQTAAQTRYAIPDISWETTESFDFGIDAVLFKDKLTLTADYYLKTTKNMLLALEIPDFMGFDNPDQNTGEMKTRGWELELGYNNSLGDLRYNVSVNFSDFRSTMGDLGGTEFLGSQVKFEGSEFNEWYGYRADGLFQTEEEVANSAVTNRNIRPGDVKYVDISGPNGTPDGVISPEYDRVLLGGSLPRYIYGGNVRLEYKNIDFAVVVQGVGKQNSRLEQRMIEPLSENWGNTPAFVDGNYWSAYNTAEQNLNVFYPRLTWTSRGSNYAMSDYWLFNGRYLRMKNITLGYRLPEALTSNLRIKNARIYASAADLFSLDQYPQGWDPEVGSTSYPITATYLMGLSVQF